LTVVAHSRQTWAALLSEARSATHLPQSCSSISNLLNHTPSLPAEESVEDAVEGGVLSLTGCSRWKVTSTRDCDLASKLKTSPRRRVNIGDAHPTFCKISDEFLPAWVGFEHVPNCVSDGNYLSAFVLGWSYVLSARLVELRKKTECDKITQDDVILPDCRFSIPIGNVDASEYIWWAAILAGGCGWQAILKRSGKSYYPLWACHLDSKYSFDILSEGTPHSSNHGTTTVLRGSPAIFI
jgi:hypothetical protein